VVVGERRWDALYGAFAGVARPAAIEGCPCCHPPEEGEALLRSPLRTLDAEALGEYAFYAMATMGTAEDFRYLAPRVLELVASGRLQSTFIENVLGKLTAAGWTSWSAPEQAAVGDVLDGFWDDSLARFPADYAIDDIVCGLCAAVGDLRPFLDRWTAALATEAGAQHLADFLDENLRVLLKHRGDRLQNSFWRTPLPTPGVQLVGWLFSPELRTAVEAAFHRAVTEAAEEALDRVDRYLGLLAPDLSGSDLSGS
jgi:hypothetical protein